MPRKRVLAVITYAGADDLCKTRIGNWLGQVNPDVVLFSGGADKQFWHPNSHVLRTGQDRYCDTHPESRDLNLPMRFTQTLKATLGLVDNSMMAEVCVIEPDVWFWSNPFRNPSVHDGFTGRMFREADGRAFWHWPYIIKGDCQAWNLANICETLLKYGASCNPWGSFPDRFVGLALELARTPYNNGNQVSFNTVSTEAEIQECLKAKAAGAYAVHGVKNQQVLERML